MSERMSGRMSEHRRIFRSCLVGVVAVALVGGILSFVGNPTPNDTWSRRFPNSTLYINSYQNPSSLGLRLNKSAGMISFGRVDYIWNRT